MLALLLSFVGVASAQEASGTYDDPTTAPGVTPALSTADGTQFAYYIRSVKYNHSFLYFPDAAGLTTTVSSATKFSVQKSDAGWVFYLLNDDDTRKGTKVQAYGPARVWQTENNSAATYDYSIVAVDGSDVISYYLTTVGRSGKDLKATAETDTRGFFYGSLDKNDDAFKWQLIPANDAAKKAAALTINVAAGDDVHGNLATFSASYPVAKPEGYTAYAATYSDGALNMTEIEGDVIPGNTGVILKGEVNASLSMQPSLTVPTTVTSALTATNETEKVVAEGDNVYGLGAKSNVLALYKLTAGTIGANKAYYTAEAGTPAIALNFGGDVTGINNAQVTNNVNAPMFDLSGRRVVKAVKGGLYIQNGKKFIVK